MEKNVFSERFLIKRPLLQALEGVVGKAPVLLIDELGISRSQIGILGASNSLVGALAALRAAMALFVRPSKIKSRPSVSRGDSFSSRWTARSADGTEWLPACRRSDILPPKCRRTDILRQ